MTDLRIQDGEGLVGAQHPTLNDSINRLTLEEHSMAGKHKVVSLEEQASTPAAVADFGKLYTKDVSGVTELFYRDSAGNETQLTGEVGGISGDAQQVVDLNFSIATNVAAQMDIHDVTVDEVTNWEQAICSLGQSSDYLLQAHVAQGVNASVSAYLVLSLKMTSSTNLRLKGYPATSGASGQTVSGVAFISAPAA